MNSARRTGAPALRDYVVTGGEVAGPVKLVMARERGDAPQVNFEGADGKRDPSRNFVARSGLGGYRLRSARHRSA